jgi:hypothetical protein
VEDEIKVFLKTIIPSRKATKKYIIEKGVLWNTTILTKKNKRS